jgi:hypothetical protein
MLNKKHILIAGALLCTGNCLFHSASATQAHLRYQNAPTRDELQQELNELLLSLDKNSNISTQEQSKGEPRKFLPLLFRASDDASLRQMPDLQKQRRIDTLFRSLEEKDRALRLETLAQRNREERNKKLRALLCSLEKEGQELIQALYPEKSIGENFVITDREFDRKLFIMHYGVSLLKDGYKLEFALEVCAAMMFLYEEGMEDLLPRNIGSVSDVVWAPIYVSMRKRASDKLKEIMKKYGANYKCIRKWCIAQQRSSWSDASYAVKYYLLQQRKDMSFDFNNIYYINKLSLEEIGKISERFFSNSKIEPEIFYNSIILCKALTAMALNKLELPGIINHETNTCIVQRGMRRKALVEVNGYDAIKEGEIFSGPMKQGIADSVALGAPPPMFSNSAFFDVIEMEIPFSRFHFAYFLFPDFCKDNKCKDRFISLKAEEPSQHECLCDMSSLPVKLRKKSTWQKPLPAKAPPNPLRKPPRK